MFLDLGLGKTICSAIVAAYKLHVEDFYSCQVIVPASLITQWVLVLKRLGVEVGDYRGTPEERKKIDTDVDFLVMSYQIFQKDFNLLRHDNIYLIVDEATVLGNSQNLLWKMINGGLVKKKVKVEGKRKPKIVETRYKNINEGACLLTATPINKPTDAYGLIQTINPGIYRSYIQFERIHVLEYDHFDNPKEYDELDLLGENLLINGTLRSAADHLDLPPLNISVIEYELHPKHMEIYKQLVEERIVEIDGEIKLDVLQATALYHALQRVIMSPEIAGYGGSVTGMEILDTLVESTNKYLVFNNYKLTNKKVMKTYDIGGSFGGLTAKVKDKFIADFKEGDLEGLACHVKSAGVGLDLPNCQYIFVTELPITPRDFYQLVGRCHRQGQTLPVFVSVLVARNTIQATLHRKIADKDDLMKKVVNTPRSLRDDLFKNIVDPPVKKTKAQVKKELLGLDS